MKLKHRDDFRVIVTPRSLGDYGGVITSDNLGRSPDRVEIEYQDRCEEIERALKGTFNVGHVQIVCDTTYTCSHCKFTWEVDEETKEPLCCDKAIGEWKKERKKNELQEDQKDSKHLTRP